MDKDTLSTLNGLLVKEDNAAYEEAMQKTVVRYNITEKNRHPAAEVRAIGKSLLDHEKEMVKAVRFNNQLYTPTDGVVSFNQTSDSTTYAIRLASPLQGDRNIKTGDSLVCALRYMAIQVTPLGDRLNYKAVAGTLTVDVQRQGSEQWVTKYTQAGLVSQEEGYDAESDTSYPVSVDLGPYLEEGRQNVRVRVGSSYTDENGIAHSFHGELYYAINSVNLRVKNLTDWSQRILASDGGFPFSFSVMGAVEKQLHVTMTGKNGTWEMSAKTFGEDEQRPESNPYNWTQTELPAYGLLSHGVHTVTAWLTCSDGMGGTLQSEAVTNRFMVVNTTEEGADLGKPYLLLQQVQQRVTNYVRTVIADYGVWVPESADNPTVASTESISVQLLVTNAGDGDSDYTTEYYDSEVQAYASTRYSIDTTIEIENSTDGESPKEYQAYLRIFREENGEKVNFLRESSGMRFVLMTVDNANDYSPVPGASFYLNPKVRNNSETDWQRIINQQTQEEIPSVWEGFGGVTDGWVTDDNGVKVLRVLAGQKLTIGYEPWASFQTNPGAQMSLEIDYAVRNITDEEEPVISISQTSADTGEKMGLEIKPLSGSIWSIGNQNENDQDFHTEEGERTHLALTVNPALVARSSDELQWQTIPSQYEERNRPTAKIYLNGRHRRSIQYSTESTGVWIEGEGHGGIRIYNPHCDIDIYGIRCYRNTSLSAQNVNRNRIASLPSAEAKNKAREENDILDGNGRVSYEKVKGKGKRCLTLVGVDNYKINQDKNTGYPCYWQIDYFDDQGQYVPELSGTIGKSAYEAYLAGKSDGAKCLMNTAQGSTANTYWFNNEQTKCDKVTYRIRIPFRTVHEDFGWNASQSDYSAESGAANPLYLDGEQIQGSSYDGLTDAEKDRVEIEVTDGWTDGNGMYHGTFYTSAIGAAKSTKLVNKINYASPMQSHKMGGTRLYNDVMKGVTGGMPHMAGNPAARFAVLEDNFYFFNQPPGYDKPIFTGLSTFGQGKCDKAAWGYDKKKMCAFEGLNNNLPLCDFRVPADEAVTYSPEDEAYVYNGDKSFEYSLGATDASGNPTETNDSYIRRYINFIYTHDIRIDYYPGSRAEFDQYYTDLYTLATQPGASPTDTQVLDKVQTTKYWIRDGSERFHLLRYDYTDNSWKDAGIWTGEDTHYSSGVRDLSTDPMTASAYEAWASSPEQGDYGALNVRFQTAIAQHFDQHCGEVLHKQNHQTHYNLVNFLFAGTDNCSKNLYYTVDLGSGGIVWLFQDDVDTIFVTDNNGRQTKAYFLSRYYDEADWKSGYKKQKDYEGSASALFNVMEYAWETVDPTALSGNMRSILTVMSGLVGANEAIDGLSVSQRQTPLGCIYKYFFSIQKYYPAMAYNEQQRIRYDYPASFGYVSYGNQARGVPALTQGIGDQLESEVQYMKRRLALVCSYAAWGDFSSGVNTGSSGLDDASGAFSLTPGSGYTGGEYTFELKPHQFIYPCGVRDRTLVNPHVRVAPGESYRLTVATAGNSVSGDSSIGLAAINYYRSIGNVGSMVSGNNTLAVQGKRLMEFVAEPPEGSSSFAPKALSIEAPNIEKLSLKGLATIGGTLNISKLLRLKVLDLSGTAVSQVRLPVTSFLQSARFGAGLTGLTVRNMPNLTDFGMDGYGKLRSIVLTGVGFDTKATARGMYEGNAPVETCEIDGIDWTDIAPALLSYLTAIKACSLQGRIGVTQGQNVDSVLKLALLRKFGAVDSEANPLYVNYTLRAVTSIAITTERFVIPQAGKYSWDVSISPVAANNFDRIAWSVSENEVGATMDADIGVLDVPRVGKESDNPTATVKCEVHTLAGQTFTDETEIKLFNRLPKLGDWAFADGEFDEVLRNKEVVGWVYKVTPYSELDEALLNHYLQDEATRVKYEAGESLYEVLVEAREEALVASKDASVNTSSLPWGLYDDSAASNGFTSEELQAMADSCGLTTSSLMDIAEIPNITKSGLRNEDGTSTSYTYIKDYNAYDDSQEDGFVKYEANTAASDWMGSDKTGKIFAHASKILDGYVGSGDMRNESGETVWDYLTADHIIPENTEELGNLLQALEQVGGYKRWWQLAFPAALACYLYEPKDSQGKTLSEVHKAYQKGRWYLPSAGDKVRLYIFKRNSTGLVPTDSSEAIKKEYSDEGNEDRPMEATDARRPCYANLLKRASDVGKPCPVKMPAQSYVWSSTESSASGARYVSQANGIFYTNIKYSRMVGRAVAAFCFEL